jgi:hypothetical protein
MQLPPLRAVIAATAVVARIVVVSGGVFGGASPAIGDHIHDLVIRNGLSHESASRIST